MSETKTLTMPVAKHKVGDQIHVKIFYKADNICFAGYGAVEGSVLHKGHHFPDRILYDVFIEQADAPHIRIQKLPEGFVLAGGPEIEQEEKGE